MEYLAHFGLFLAQTLTVVAAIAFILTLIVGLRQKNTTAKGQIQLTDLSEQYDETAKLMQSNLLNSAERKAWEKELKKEAKDKRKQDKISAKKGHVEDKNSEGKNSTSQLSVEGDTSLDTAVSEVELEKTAQSSEKSDLCLQPKSRVYVLDFDGGMNADEVNALRQEITAVLSIATPIDQVVIRLTSPGGVVHGYGLAASQLARIKQADISLVAIVDKVAASGGYMMACVADKIVAAPFAIIGSIGVVAQVPNFHRLLQKNEIDVELHTAGAFKRTLTLFGENTEEGREKFRQELNETHDLFKQFVSKQRPQLDIESVATGEHWYGSVAKDKGLVDEISTSDDYLLNLYKTNKVLSVKYVMKKSITERVTKSASQSLINSLLSIWQNNQRPQI